MKRKVEVWVCHCEDFGIMASSLKRSDVGASSNCDRVVHLVEHDANKEAVVREAIRMLRKVRFRTTANVRLWSAVEKYERGLRGKK